MSAADVAKWATMPMLGFDLETTGIDVFTDRIVTAALVQVRDGVPVKQTDWLVDPGVEIPDEAAAVHGITTERARAEGGDPGQMLFELTGQLALSMGRVIPTVIANAPYDLTMLEAENRRYDIDSLASRVNPKPIGPVIDPMVLDKHADKYRKSCYKAPGCRPEDRYHECGGCQGSRLFNCGGCGATDRTLASLCLHYGVELTGAHDAGADALAACLLVPKIIARFPNAFRGFTVGALHQAQIGWNRTQLDGLRAWFDKNGIEHDGCDPAWPIRSTPVTTTPAQGALL